MGMITVYLSAFRIHVEVIGTITVMYKILNNALAAHNTGQTLTHHKGESQKH